MINKTTFILSILTMIWASAVIYTYYHDVREIQQLKEEKLRLEIENLKAEIQKL